MDIVKELKLLWRRLGFHVHDWGIWEVEKEIGLFDVGCEIPYGELVIQKRECSICKKLKYGRIRK